jgi:[acyl-carrier-protein] S-malonyltransferase
MGKALVDGTPKGDAATAIDTLVRQESAPVPWEAVVGCLASEGVTTYVEVGPGSTLSGMVKKIHAGARIVRFGSPLDLDSVMAACSN